MERIAELDMDDDRDEVMQIMKDISVEDVLAFLNQQLLRMNQLVSQYTLLLKLYQGIYQDVAQLLLDKVGVKMPVVKELTTTLQQLDQRFASVAQPQPLDRQLYLLRRQQQP